MAKSKTSEHKLQTQVLRYLERHHVEDVFGFAIPNAGRRTFRAAGKLKAEGMLAGAPDLCILLRDGLCLWLELKSERGRLSDEQQGFRARCERLGHIYRAARDLPEAVDVLRSVGAVRQ